MTISLLSRLILIKSQHSLLQSDLPPPPGPPSQDRSGVVSKRQERGKSAHSSARLDVLTAWVVLTAETPDDLSSLAEGKHVSRKISCPQAQASSRATCSALETDPVAMTQSRRVPDKFHSHWSRGEREERVQM